MTETTYLTAIERDLSKADLVEFRVQGATGVFIVQYMLWQNCQVEAQLLRDTEPRQIMSDGRYTITYSPQAGDVSADNWTEAAKEDALRRFKVIADLTKIARPRQPFQPLSEMSIEEIGQQYADLILMVDSGVNRYGEQVERDTDHLVGERISDLYEEFYYNRGDDPARADYFGLDGFVESAYESARDHGADVRY